MKAATLTVLLLCGMVGPALAEVNTTRPMPRPERVAPAIAAPDLGTAVKLAQNGPSKSIRPEPRPQMQGGAQKKPAKSFLGKLFGAPKAAQPKEAAQAPKKGSVCKDRAIRGTVLASIKGAKKGCGVENPVRVTEVAGVALSTPATLSCETAVALRTWVTQELKPAFGKAGVTRLRVAAHYACRTRNNKAGARISEHGRGKAIDISGFTLANGTELTVLKHYKSRQGKPIRAAHKGACGIFGTTLGPGSDGYHRDHLHLDTASYRGGPYCK